MHDSLAQHRKQLGQTGITVSPIGLGTVKFGRNQKVKYPSPFDLPGENELADFLELAKSLGINTLDTAPAYGLSEERLGRLLNGQRSEWTIIGKAGENFVDGESCFDFSADGVEKSVNESLERLKTDYIDVLLIHSDGRDTEILNDDALIRRLDDLKSQNLVKAHGISTKTVEGGLYALEKLDCVMATYHPAYTDEKPVLDTAKKMQKGVILKKALASGHVKDIAPEGVDPVEYSLSHAFAEDSVASVIIGTISRDHMRHNVKAALKALQSPILQQAESRG